MPNLFGMGENVPPGVNPQELDTGTRKHHSAKAQGSSKESRVGSQICTLIQSRPLV